MMSFLFLDDDPDGGEDTDQLGILLDFDEVPTRTKETGHTNLSAEDKLRHLQLVPEFAEMEEADLSPLAAVAQLKQLIKGQTLWDQGNHASECCVVVEGRLMSMRLMSEPCGPHTLVGHLPLLAADTEAGCKRPAAIVATVPTLVLLISYEALSQVLDLLNLPDDARLKARTVCAAAHPYV